MTCVSQGGQLVLSGTIDETAKLVELLSMRGTVVLILDLGAISFINSPDVRAWISIQQVAASQCITLELRRVPEPIVHQLDIVPAARGVSLVSSFLAPYECEECDREQVMLLDVRLHGAELARMRPPPMTCPDCKRSMSFAHPPELYFAALVGDPSARRVVDRGGVNAIARGYTVAPSKAASLDQLFFGSDE